MINLNRILRSSVFTLAPVLLLAACGSQPEKKQTLADIDKGGRQYSKDAQEPKKIKKEDIKKAYYDYIKGADKDDKLRVRAATRIAELELELGGEDEPNEKISSDAYFESTVKSTITLLNETLQNFPDSPNNDDIMYQLAKAYDQVGEGDRAIAVLDKMVRQFPETQYYIEAKFRIAEFAFVNADYFRAEDSYTDVLKTQNNEVFYEKALFKRGWARYKQELYSEALNDYYDAAERHRFASYESLNSKDKGVFDEYFRAISLAYTYMGGAQAIASYFEERGEDVFAFETYRSVSDIFLKQERYSDAVATFDSYVENYPEGKGVIKAGLASIDIWKRVGLFNKYTNAFESFYQRYNGKSSFWRLSAGNISGLDKKQAIETIRSNLVLLAGHYHNSYNKKPKEDRFLLAERWYKRYLDNYSTYAKQDKIYPLYASLLKSSGRYKQALSYYEISAFDGNIILDKESAYAAVFITDRMYSQTNNKKDKADILKKHIDYVYLYGQLYSDEPHTPQAILHAVELTFNNQQLNRTIELANILSDKASAHTARKVGLLKAQAYFNLEQYEDSEVMYQDLLASVGLPKKERINLQNKLALSVYRQAEKSRSESDIAGAARQFLKIHHEIPESELAPTAVYDAIALFMSNNMWNEAIDYLNVFKKSYPTHPFQTEVSKKLSVAYLKSNRGLEAAREFENLSDFVSNEDEKMAALWQAAKLYNSKDDLESALRAYKEYAHTYKRPYAENMEAMFTVSDIYKKMGQRENRYFWLRQMAKSDKKAPKSVKTDRTRYIAASASYEMALLRSDDYHRIKLNQPFEKTLLLKKSALQESVQLFDQSAEYGHEEFVTQATYETGEIYRDFAVALLESERPKGLSDDELEQYEIILEDQSFPFEDRAIELYEVNLERIAGGVYDKAVKQSLQQLRVLFPARYDRTGKSELFVEKL